MVLCMDFTHGFGHDGLLSIVFCRSFQGTTVMLKSKVNGLGFMDASVCIYMYCNIERNIMKKNLVVPILGSMGKSLYLYIYIYIYISILCFMFSPLFIFCF